jgi:hypothetical protein
MCVYLMHVKSVCLLCVFLCTVYSVGVRAHMTCLYMSICTRMWAYLCTYVSMHVFVYICACLYVCMDVWFGVCTYVSLVTCMYISLCVCTHICVCNHRGAVRPTQAGNVCSMTTCLRTTQLLPVDHFRVPTLASLGLFPPHPCPLLPFCMVPLLPHKGRPLSGAASSHSTTGTRTLEGIETPLT